MALDHTKAAVTISFSGLALSCINQKDEYEFGIIGCDRHRPVFDIQKIYLDPKTMTPINSELVDHSLSLNDDIEIEVLNPEQAGVLKFAPPAFNWLPEFDRLNDKGDEEDFRWVVDLEGEEFHNEKLEFKDPSQIKPRIFISSGILYTEIIADEIMARVSANGRQGPWSLGRVAFRVGMDVICKSVDGGVILRNKNDQSEACPPLMNGLNNDPPNKYLITIENLCTFDRNRAKPGTDFRHFYDVLRDSDDREFDLQRVVDNAGRGDLGKVTDNRPDHSLDTPPLNCLIGSLSRTAGLP